MRISDEGDVGSVGVLTAAWGGAFKGKVQHEPGLLELADGCSAGAWK